MAVQILDRPGSGQIAAESMGQGFDQLLGSLGKRSQLKKESKGLESLGISKEQARAIVNLPPKLQEIALNSILAGQRNIKFAKSRQSKKTDSDLIKKEQPMSQREQVEQTLSTAASNARLGMPQAGPQYNTEIQELIQSQEFANPLLNSLRMLMPGGNIRPGRSLFSMGNVRKGY